MKAASQRTRTTSARSGSRSRAQAAPRNHTAEAAAAPGQLLDGLALSRRQLIMGAAGTAAVAAAAVGISALSSKSKDADEDASALSVGVDEVFSLDDCSEEDASDCMSLDMEMRLPYHTLVWASNDSYACCLVPTDGASPITMLSIADLASGTSSIVLDAPVSEGRGYDICDARCSEQGVVWTEANAFTGEWRVYHATHDGSSIGEPVLADQGTTDYDIPTLAVSESRAFWQVLPGAALARTAESLLKSSRFGHKGTDLAYRSQGRMSTPPYACNEGIVITPRAKGPGVSYQLTLIDGSSLSELDRLRLPSSMAPLEAGYVNGRFSFSFDAIYKMENGISNLGSYVPVKAGAPKPGESWFRFSRNPSAPPAWSGQWFMVKSTRAVSGVDVENRLVFALDCPDRCDDFGDYLASTGTRGTIVTYVHVNDEKEQYTLLRAWKPLQA